MRVLLVSLPGGAHVFPAVPLAWALRAAGHDVVMATAAAGLRARESGLSVADVRPGLQLSDLTQLMTKTSPGTVEALRSMRKNMEIVPDAFVVLSTELTDGTVDFAGEWRPDLIVHSPMHGGALVAAAVLQVPAVLRRRLLDGKQQCQLVLPDGADRHLNADAIAARGAGLVGDPAGVDAGLVDQLLTEDSFRGNAADVSMELRRMPTPAELVDRLSELAAA